jgi:hypothetical protein
MVTLNHEHARHAHVGKFDEVFEVPVAHAYEDEQRLFQLLSPCRISLKREFFIAPLGHIQQAMMAVSCKSLGLDLHACDHLPNGDHLPEARRLDTANEWGQWPDLHGINQAWVVLARNPCHRAGIYRVAATGGHPMDCIGRMNVPQRRLTSQIGFYRLVDAIPSNQPHQVVRQLFAKVRSQRMKRSNFVDMPVEAVRHALEEVIQAFDADPPSNPACAPAPDSLNAVDLGRHPRRLETKGTGPTRATTPTDTKPDAIPQHLGNLVTAENVCPYWDCFARITFQGELAQIGERRCPSCRRKVGFQINGTAATVWHD